MSALTCPNCGHAGVAHWEAEALGTPGRYTCTSRSPRSWQIRLDFPRPPKGLSANDRAHWAVKAKSTKLVRGLVVQRVQYARIPKLGRCRVQLEWIVVDERVRDEDNLAPMAKAVYDAIGSNKGVSAHLVADDNPDHMEKPQALIVLDENEHAPYFLITITDLTEGTTQ